MHLDRQLRLNSKSLALVFKPKPLYIPLRPYDVTNDVMSHSVFNSLLLVDKLKSQHKCSVATNHNGMANVFVFGNYMLP